MTLTERDREIDTLARTIWAEARGDGLVGMEASAAVIANRVRRARTWIGRRAKPHPLFGDGTFADACTRPRQFSCWNADDPNLPKLRAVTRDDPIFAQAIEIAERAVGGELADPTGGATHYHTISIQPEWAKGREPCKRIGHHVFYNNV